MSNWARAYMVFEPVPPEEKFFQFVAAKRGKRIGWGTLVRYFKHSENGELRWVPATAEEESTLKAAKKAKRGRVVIDPAKIVELIPIEGEIEREILIQEIMNRFQVGKDRAVDEIKLLEAHETVKSNSHYRNNLQKKGGRKSIFLSRNDQKEEKKGS